MRDESLIPNIKERIQSNSQLLNKDENKISAIPSSPRPSHVLPDLNIPSSPRPGHVLPDLNIPSSPRPSHVLPNLNPT
jgi:hypothetical protein